MKNLWETYTINSNIIKSTCQNYIDNNHLNVSISLNINGINIINNNKKINLNNNNKQQSSF